MSPLILVYAARANGRPYVDWGTTISSTQEAVGQRLEHEIRLSADQEMVRRDVAFVCLSEEALSDQRSAMQLQESFAGLRRSVWGAGLYLVLPRDTRRTKRSLDPTIGILECAMQSGVHDVLEVDSGYVSADDPARALWFSIDGALHRSYRRQRLLNGPACAGTPLAPAVEVLSEHDRLFELVSDAYRDRHPTCLTDGVSLIRAGDLRRRISEGNAFAAPSGLDRTLHELDIAGHRVTRRPHVITLLGTSAHLSQELRIRLHQSAAPWVHCLGDLEATWFLRALMRGRQRPLEVVEGRTAPLFSYVDRDVTPLPPHQDPFGRLPVLVTVGKTTADVPDLLELGRDLTSVAARTVWPPSRLLVHPRATPAAVSDLLHRSLDPETGLAMWVHVDGPGIDVDRWCDAVRASHRSIGLALLLAPAADTLANRLAAMGVEVSVGTHEVLPRGAALRLASRLVEALQHDARPAALPVGYSFALLDLRAQGFSSPMAFRPR